ncbi:hypothetical protein ANN_22612 [Periplaneta americana]|uniref:Reverse transcriptase n=1 Tax=Periplaneta americana TaxID=6978 RepID=A0ABQ8S932_PERAM|nr:hypothetical protein ANN_22612 [Periplaneta americana]
MDLREVGYDDRDWINLAQDRDRWRAYADASDNAGEMNPGSSTESYPAFPRVGLRENHGKNLNQVTCPDRDSNPGHLVSQPDALTVTPQLDFRNEVLRIKYFKPSLFKAQWEAYLQHLNICNTLLRTSNPLVVSTRNIAAEKKVCSRKLKIPPEDLDISNINVHKLRQNLRKQEYDKWCALPHKGKGVILFQEYTPGNKWIFSKEGLSSSEWRDAIKMNANVAPVRSLHGRSLDGFRCRYCNEIETLAHVLGSCQHGELLRNSRHHNIRKLIAQALRNKSFEVHEEVHCVASEGGGIRRADIVALDKTNSKGFILDPTVRFEMSQTQPSEVNKEKQQIYEPTIPYFREKYQMEGTWEVHGLMIGARGTIPRSTVNTIKTFGIHDIIPKIITSTIKGSVAILKNHLYGIS